MVFLGARLIKVSFILLALVGSIGGIHAQQQVETDWYLHTYVWNENLDVWARSTCEMEVGGVGNSGVIRGCSANEVRSTGVCEVKESCNGSQPQNHAVRYYHEPNNAQGIASGELHGSAWSPVYGSILFSEDTFPPSYCFELSGEARQPRVVKTSRGNVILIGCVYVPSLQDYILLSPSPSEGETIPGVSSYAPRGYSGNWSGVQLETVTVGSGSGSVCQSGASGCVNPNVNSPYIKVSGCGYSQNHGKWAFGPDSSTASSNCLPGPRYSSNFKKVLDTALLGFRGSHVTSCSLQPEKRSIQIGEVLTFRARCPFGYADVKAATVVYPDGTRSGDLANRLTSPNSIRGFFEYLFSEPVFSRISSFELTCKDRHEHNIFGDRPGACRGGQGVSVRAVSLGEFSLKPAFFVEGGLADFDASIENFADPSVFNTFCKIKRVIDDKVVSCFKVEDVYTNTLSSSLSSNNPHFSKSDLVLQDSSYELTCWYDQEADPNQAISNHSSNTLCTNASVSDGWASVGPVRTLARVLPSRIVEIGIGDTVPTPSFEESNQVVHVQIPSDLFSSDPGAPTEVVVYGVTESIRVIDASNPFKRLLFFEDLAIAREWRQGFDGVTCSSLTCVNNGLSGVDEVIIGTSQVRHAVIDASSLGDRYILVAETRVGSGRSPKVKYTKE